MDHPKRNFRTCVLNSGLVTPAELDQTIVALWTERSGGKAVAQVEISQEELADRLIALGRLTQYQAKQMLAGRSKLKLGQYRILEPIGHGGMGEVFKAEHEFMGRIVAIKVLPMSKATPSATASFIHEIRSQARLQHVNLVQAYDAGRDGNVYYLVTEYVNAADLRKYVRQNGPLSMKAAATIISQAAKGLGHAHAQGLIHRDVKPGNLLVTPEGITKVSDLGLAAWLNETEPDPRAGKIVGTADYLSPEQILTPRQITAASDVYSLGCTLYYAVTGKVPFTGGGTRDKTRRHLEDMPLHPRRLNAELTDPFVDVIAAMMDKNVAQRIQTAAEVVRRLAPWAEDRVAAPVPQTTERETLPFSYAMPQTEESDDEGFAGLPETNWQYEESLSQGSQGTETFAAISEETVPAPGKSDIWLPPRRKLTREMMLIYGAAALGVLALAYVLLHSLLR